MISFPQVFERNPEVLFLRLSLPVKFQSISETNLSSIFLVLNIQPTKFILKIIARRMECFPLLLNLRGILNNCGRCISPADDVLRLLVFRLTIRLVILRYLLFILIGQMRWSSILKKSKNLMSLYS